jgi:hypothetical protein
MKKPKFKYVPQRWTDDCVVASLAMVTGYDYREIDNCFKRAKNGGIVFSDAITFLKDCGLTVITKVVDGCSSIEKANGLMLVPFADIHLVQGTLDCNTNDTHCFVMTKTGKCYNPNIHAKFLDPYEGYYSIPLIAGIYYEK